MFKGKSEEIIALSFIFLITSPFVILMLFINLTVGIVLCVPFILVAIISLNKKLSKMMSFLDDPRYDDPNEWNKVYPKRKVKCPKKLDS